MNAKLGFIFAVAVAVNVHAAAPFKTQPWEDSPGMPLGSIAPLVLSNTDLSVGGVKAYRPWFENGSWQGDIVEYHVSTLGSLCTSINLSGLSPVAGGACTGLAANWSALLAFDEAENDPDTGATYWSSGRKIITARNNVQKPFIWSTDSLGAAAMSALDQDAVTTAAGSSDVLDWIRGDRSNEFPPPGTLRARISIMGDVIHGNAFYVGPPNANLSDNSYPTWAAGKSARDERIYVGANDGMLHAFDADDGTEAWAYIPSMVIGELDRLAARPYDHYYFVDGKITVADAYFDSAWHTVLVGTLGAGGAGVFALDVTNPSITDQAATSGDDIKVLWELDGSDADLGDTFSRPVVVKLNDGDWWVAFGNGYNSGNGDAILYLRNLNTDEIKKITASSSTAAAPNGLSSPTLIDADQDGAADYAYAGDIDGNLWKFDLSGASVSSWVLAYNRALHPAVSGQSITTAPEVARHPSGGFMVYFATGRLFDASDAVDNTVQAMYGIHDDGTTPPASSGQSLLTSSYTGVTFTATGISEEVGVFRPDQGAVQDSQHGWKVNFPAGYRVLEGIELRGGRPKVTVHKPSGRENWLAEAYYLDGGPYGGPIFDLNQDNRLNDSDLVAGATAGTLDVPMAWRASDGIMSKVTIARLGQGRDTMFLNWLQPPVDEPCTADDDCPDGFQGGHIDVDTWSNDQEFGGASSKHTHEYDKATGRVYVDFFDTNVPAAESPVDKDVDGHIEINNFADSGIAGSDAFIILMANADFSRGSTFKVGDLEWNVAQYQREIYMALKNWDPAEGYDALKDSNDNKLVFTWSDIYDAADAKSNISHNFNDLAIIAGGLHPTQTGCVKDSAYGDDKDPDNATYDPATKIGRWRNGALTTQLVKASHFVNNPALNQVDIQLPTDMETVVILPDGTQVSMTDGDDVIGGLIASSQTEHIWESTLFWHFGKLYDLVYGGKPCYGEDDWLAAVEFEQDENAFNNALEILDIDDLDAALAEYSVCKDDKDSECAEIYKVLEKLEDLRDSYGSGSIEPDDDFGDGENPMEIGGGVEPPPGPNPGPDFDYGRISWTDVVPD